MMLKLDKHKKKAQFNPQNRLALRSYTSQRSCTFQKCNAAWRAAQMARGVKECLWPHQWWLLIRAQCARILSLSMRGACQRRTCQASPGTGAAFSLQSSPLNAQWSCACVWRSCVSDVKGPFVLSTITFWVLRPVRLTIKLELRMAKT